MATAAQITANQANAHHSTGPQTAAGKARVAQNAIRHGLTATHLVVRDDQIEEFNELHESLRKQLDPRGAIEAATFDDLLHAAWNLHRFRQIEAESSSGTAEDFSDRKTATVLDRLGRYQARAQRAYYRALKELRVLQTNLALRDLKLDPDDDAEVPALACIRNLTKQTQSDAPSPTQKLALQILKHEVKHLQPNSLQSFTERNAGPSPFASAA